MLKTLLIVATVGCTIDSCHDAHVVERVQQEYKETHDACIEHGGVPVEGTVMDTNTQAVYRTVVRCEWPRKAERP
jgi:hypothetical protein